MASSPLIHSFIDYYLTQMSNHLGGRLAVQSRSVSRLLLIGNAGHTHRTPSTHLLFDVNAVAVDVFLVAAAAGLVLIRRHHH